MPGDHPHDTSHLPYRIAVLCYLFDEQGRLLLLHRRKAPNRDLYSPIGGKLEQAIGESPTACAVREIQEEVGLAVSEQDLHLTGIVSETAFEDQGHWLMFLFEMTRPAAVERMEFDEGRLEWHDVEAVTDLNIPDTDRQIIWPQFLAHRGGFFAAHIDCHGGKTDWAMHQSTPAADLVGPSGSP
jgi:8-oxo-dGTP diphosphatase